MAIHDLPDMHALSPRACEPWASGIHIRQIPQDHITTITCMPKAQGHMYRAYISGTDMYAR